MRHGSPLRLGLPPIAVFDLDGTLAETAPDLVRTLNVLLAREGAPPVALAQARDMIGAGARALIERGLAASGRSVPKARIEEMYDEFLDHYAAHICIDTTAYPGVPEALERLEEAGYALAVCTNKVEAHAVALLEALGLDLRFAAICGRDTFPACKPDPRHLTLTIARAGGDPERAVMVGDSRTDFVTARGAGVPTIGYPFGYTDTPVEELGPDLVIRHFDELFDAVEALIPPLVLKRAASA